jgi:hypothetical protein
MKLKVSDIISVLYTVIMIGFTIYWANNYKEFVKYKGEEFFVFIILIVIFTYLFLLFLQFSDQRFTFLMFLLLPIGIAIASFIIMVLFFLISGIAGIPSQTIYIYSITYTAITLLSILYSRLKFNR